MTKKINEMKSLLGSRLQEQNEAFWEWYECQKEEMEMMKKELRKSKEPQISLDK